MMYLAAAVQAACKAPVVQRGLVQETLVRDLNTLRAAGSGAVRAQRCGRNAPFLEEYQRRHSP